MDLSGLEKAIRSAHIPPAVSWVCSHIRTGFPVAVVLADGDPPPPLALQFLRLPRLFSRISLRECRTAAAGEGSSISIEGNDRTLRIDGEALASAEIGDYAVELFRAGNPGAEFSFLFNRVAVFSQALESLHGISRYMLGSTDLDMLQHLFLTGLTAGYGLGFNRAVLFVHDPVSGCLTGEKAIGSRTLAEARAIWEQIETADQNIGDFIARYLTGDRFIDSSLLGELEHSCINLAGIGAEDEVQRALGHLGVSVFHGPAHNPSLAALEPGEEYLLAPLRSHDRLWGMVFADNAFNRRPLDAELVSITELFVNQTALLWENFSMLESLRREAKEDFLTGVANRNEMEKILDYLFSIEKPDLRFYLLLIDIDDFKGINDRHGHAWGDRILVEHSRILKSLLRGNDFVARYGGDEFLVVIRDLDLAKVREIAERLREEIRGQLETTVSIGVAYYPRDSRSRIGLFEMADRALYRAKQNGRNCVVFYGDP